MVAGIVLLLIAIVLVLVWRTTGQKNASRANPADAQQVALGQQVYAANCASCHGANLEGQPEWRTELPTGGMPAPPHDQSGHTWHHPDDFLFNVTKNGGQTYSPPGYKNNMPALGTKLSDEQIWAALAFIKSRWPAEIQKSQLERSRSSGIRRVSPRGATQPK